MFKKLLFFLVLSFALFGCGSSGGNKEDEIENTVNVNLYKIEITTLPIQTIYYVGDTFDSKGIVINAIMSDGSKKNITNFTISAPDMSSEGTKTVTVSYIEGTITKTVNFDITVKSKTTTSDDDFTFEEYEEGYKIVDYIGSSKDINIPSSYNGKMVTFIGNSAFDKKQLTNVVIPNSIKLIDEFAFSENQLTNIVIPNSVISIEAYAFEKNQLKEVILSNTVTSIGFGAFSENQLTNLVIPNSVISIEDFAFENNQLENLILGNSMKSISSFVFSNNKLKNITIPESVTIICNGAFSWNSLESVTIPSSVTAIGDYAFTYNDFRTLTIKGKAGSYAETYAKNNFLKFVAQ